MLYYEIINFRCVLKFVIVVMKVFFGISVLLVMYEILVVKFGVVKKFLCCNRDFFFFLIEIL